MAGDQLEPIAAGVQELGQGRVGSQGKNGRNERERQLRGAALPLPFIRDGRHGPTEVCDEPEYRCSVERGDMGDAAFERERASLALAEPAKDEVPEPELARRGPFADLQLLRAEQIEDLEPFVEVDAIHAKHAEPAVLDAVDERAHAWMQRFRRARTLEARERRRAVFRSEPERRAGNEQVLLVRRELDFRRAAVTAKPP